MIRWPFPRSLVLVLALAVPPSPGGAQTPAPATPVTPSRIRSPMSDSGEPAYQLVRLAGSVGTQVSAGARNVRASDPTKLPAMAPGTKLMP